MADMYIRLFSHTCRAKSAVDVADLLSRHAPVRLVWVDGFSAHELDARTRARAAPYLATPMTGQLVNAVFTPPNCWVASRVSLVPTRVPPFLPGGPPGARPPPERVVVTSELWTAGVPNILVVSAADSVPADGPVRESVMRYDVIATLSSPEMSPEDLPRPWRDNLNAWLALAEGGRSQMAWFYSFSLGEFVAEWVDRRGGG